jgi:uncharacterized protein (DUF1778 family)
MLEGIGVVTNTKVSKPKEKRTAGLGIKMLPSLKKVLDEAAAEDGRTTSQYVERVLVAHFQEKGKWPK